jgi:ankyrin repeat protein
MPDSTSPAAAPSDRQPGVLPDKPHLDHLRRQARDLHRALKRGDAAALARAAPYRVDAGASLAQAQLVLARDHGFASWPLLVEEVERRRARAADDAGFVAAWLPWAIGQGYSRPRPERAWALAQTRAVAQRDGALVLALACGDLAAVQRLLPPPQVHAPLPPLAAPPIAIAAFSGLARIAACRDGLRATVRWLLAQGADANTRLGLPGVEHPLPVLYGATAHAGDGEIVRALLAAGADPNDNESLYHATEQADRSILDALVQAGARWAGTNALFRQLDHDDLPGLQQALALGADANELSPTVGTRPLHHALMRGRGLPFVQALVSAGADPAARDSHGLAVAWHAERVGMADVVAWLAAIGHAVPAHDLRSRFLAACAAADEPGARAVLAAQPGLLQQLGPMDLRLLPEQAQRGQTASVRLMLALGWPVSVPGPWDASALNQAAFRGDAGMVALLLRHGARWDERNGYGGTALGSCLHAGVDEPVPGGDYAAVLHLLLDAGAPVPQPEPHWPDAMATVAEQAAASGPRGHGLGSS